MRTMIAWLLLLVGGLLVLYGIGSAVLLLAGLYEANLTDPMNQPEGSEDATAGAMMRAVIIGAAGVPLFVIGAVMLKVTLIQRIARSKRR